MLHFAINVSDHLETCRHSSLIDDVFQEKNDTFF